jgi:hypothetical protein
LDRTSGAGAVFAPGARERAEAALPLGSANDGDDGEAVDGEDKDPAFGNAGTRGNENISFNGGKDAPAAGETILLSSVGAAVEPVAPGTRTLSGELAGELGTAFAFAPAGRAVGAEDGIPVMPGNENISLPGGSEGATAKGDIFPAAKESGCEAGTCVSASAPGASAVALPVVALPSDAAIARRSASDNGPGCADAGES